jgi:hypothetical protein
MITTRLTIERLGDRGRTGHLGRQGWHRYNDHVQHPPVDVGACRAGLLDGLDRGFAAVAGYNSRRPALVKG